MNPYKSIGHSERAIYGNVPLQKCLCNTLLPKLISGQTRVPEAETFVTEHMS